MTSIRPETAATPGDRPGGTAPVSKSTTRRTIQLDELVDAEPEQEPVPAPRATFTAPRPTDRLLRLAELAVGDWAPTLRDALLRTLIFAVILVALGVALGLEFAIAGGVVGLVAFLVGRRRGESR